MKNKTVLSIVSFIIVFVMIAVPVVMLRNVDDYIDGNKDITTAPPATTVPDETPGNTSGEASTPSGLVETNDYVWYLNEATGCGYHTDKTTNKTYFFRSVDGRHGEDLSRCTVTFNSVVYANYTPAFYMSKDPLSDITDFFGYGWCSVDYYEVNTIRTSDEYPKCYFTYTVIDNCENPSYVLSILEQNVFFNLTYFSVSYASSTQAVG